MTNQSGSCLLLFLCSLCLLQGCAYTASPVVPDVTTRHVDTKNYEISKQLTAGVGEQMVRVKSYDAVLARDHMTPSKSFRVTGGLSSASVNVSGGPMEPYRVTGTIKHNNEVCNVIAIPGSIFGLGIRPNGMFAGIAVGQHYATSPIAGVNQYKIEPTDTRFEYVTTETPMRGRPYVNHELIYSGKAAGQLRILYREYTLDNLARPAFSQEIVYDDTASQIRFRNYRIRIYELNSEKIVFAVLED